MRFPLAEWILRHRNVPHNLARSGMVGELATTEGILASSRPGDLLEVTNRLAEILHVDPHRVFLTHGATESNSVVLLFLARGVRQRHQRAPRLRIVPPEYLPTSEGAWAIGYVPAGRRPADVDSLSQPNNPSGLLLPSEELARRGEGATAMIVDETFREFTPSRSAGEDDQNGRWVTGSLTKAYGADHVRVGYVVAPSDQCGAFEPFLSLVLDELPTASAGQALAIFDQRETILRESRARLQENLRVLRRGIPDAPTLAAPVWFDVGIRPRDGSLFATRALAEGVLVCPGRFFGTPHGVRICLTRRSFPADLEAYLPLRHTTSS